MQVNDVHLNTCISVGWARGMVTTAFSLRKAQDGFNESTSGRLLTRLKYMHNRKSFPTWGGGYVHLATPCFKSIMDYVASFRAWTSSASTACWLFDHSMSRS